MYQKAYNLTNHLMDGNIRNLRYLVQNAFPGIYSTLVHNYGLGRSDEVVKGMKDAIYDFISEEAFGGCEPTFTSEETYNFWNNLKDSSFEPVYKRSQENGNLHIKPELQIEGAIFEQ